jgi:hypothetical protein
LIVLSNKFLTVTPNNPNGFDLTMNILNLALRSAKNNLVLYLRFCSEEHVLEAINLLGWLKNAFEANLPVVRENNARQQMVPGGSGAAGVGPAGAGRSFTSAPATHPERNGRTLGQKN